MIDIMSRRPQASSTEQLRSKAGATTPISRSILGISKKFQSFILRFQKPEALFHLTQTGLRVILYVQRHAGNVNRP